MNIDDSASWHVRLANLRSQRSSQNRDLELSELFDEPFDDKDARNLEQLFLAFISNIDTSVLQGAENAFGRVQFPHYFAALGRCFGKLMSTDPKTATERLNFPPRALSDAEIRQAFSAFEAGLDDRSLLEEMRATIVKWRLLGDEPYRTFFYLSQSLKA